MGKCEWTDRYGKEHKCHVDEREFPADYDGGTHCIFHAREKDEARFLQQFVSFWYRTGNVVTMSGFQFVGPFPWNDVRLPHDGQITVVAKVLKFDYAVFRDPLDLNSLSFANFVSFKHTHFLKEIRANGTVFKKQLLLNSILAEEIVEFSDAEFRDQVMVIGAEFRKLLSFRRAGFLLESVFDRSIFHSLTDFSECSFGKVGRMQDIAVCEGARIMWPGRGLYVGEGGVVRPRGRLEFHRLKYQDVNAYLDFTDNFAGSDATTAFIRCDLSRVLLRGTDCTNVIFFGSSWNRSDTSGKGRNKAFDEVFAQSRPEQPEAVTEGAGQGVRDRWQEIGILYQQLAKNYREKLDHQYANDFDRGVFEMRLKSAIRQDRDGEASLLGIYRLLSNFGGSIVRPLFWLPIAVLVFGLVYQFTLHDSRFTLDHSIWGCEGLVTAIQVSLLNWKGLDETVSSSSCGLIPLFWLLALFQAAFTTTVFALLVFAIRRRFKH